ncbi:hypothetical protein QYE76_050160 [Lolium multiflorum]|uniref:Uncharacterized protein n=1 Tax=Lolium multiflorum TaxID=4521 RepID=A0AAD8SR66_LOLMU|nr:hypothetical protein QYE76_050160 [Lolium multiflorum]
MGLAAVASLEGFPYRGSRYWGFATEALSRRKGRNPSKEIFSESDEINAQHPIFPRSFQNTRGARRGPRGPPDDRPARPVAAPPCNGVVASLTFDAASSPKPPRPKTSDGKATVRNLPEPPPSRSQDRGQSLFGTPRDGSAPESFSIDTTAIFINAAVSHEERVVLHRARGCTDKTLLDTSCSGSFTRNKEEFKRDLLNRIQENTEGWEIDKDRESGICLGSEPSCLTCETSEGVLRDVDNLYMEEVRMHPQGVDAASEESCRSRMKESAKLRATSSHFTTPPTNSKLNSMTFRIRTMSMKTGLNNSEMIRNLTYRIDELQELIEKLVGNSSPSSPEE